jgi:hypothetical protein
LGIQAAPMIKRYIIWCRYSAELHVSGYPRDEDWVMINDSSKGYPTLEEAEAGVERFRQYWHFDGQTHIAEVSLPE